MPKKRIRGAEAFGLAAHWDFVQDDGDLARELILFLEDRRVLFGRRHQEDEHHCVQSALDIRRELARLLPTATAGKQLELSMRAIQAACRDFLEAAGPDGDRFRHGFSTPGMDPFATALAELRVKVGIHVGLVVDFYRSVNLAPELAAIIPSAPDDDDVGWLADQIR